MDYFLDIVKGAAIALPFGLLNYFLFQYIIKKQKKDGGKGIKYIQIYNAFKVIIYLAVLFAVSRWGTGYIMGAGLTFLIQILLTMYIYLKKQEVK